MLITQPGLAGDVLLLKMNKYFTVYSHIPKSFATAIAPKCSSAKYSLNMAEYKCISNFYL